MRITKKAMKAYLKHKLGTDKRWAEQALCRIYERQTADEQALGNTSSLNGIGFTGFDGTILSGLVEYITEKRKTVPTYNFSNKQFNGIIFQKMPKYWKQVLEISDQNKLEHAFKNDPFNIQTKLKLED